VSLVKSGDLPLDKLIKHYRLETLNQAVADMHDGKTIKPVVIYD